MRQDGRDVIVLGFGSAVGIAAHDAAARVPDAFGAPIPGLWEAGEIGNVFGDISMSGGNLAECFTGGRIAGTRAAHAAGATA